MLRDMRNLPLLLGLAACGSSSAYPKYGGTDDDLDTGELVLPPEPTIPCTTYGTGAAYSLTVVNQLRQPIALSFVDAACNELSSARIDGYQTVTTGGSDGMVWVVRTTNGAYIEHFVVPTNVGDYVVTVP